MNEAFLHHVWKFKLFQFNQLKTLSGKSINILNVGLHNQNAGPDFLEAKVKIDQLTWFGAIEIHLKSSDWNLHQHSSDPNYQHLILHVVYEHDKEIEFLTQNAIETIELKDHLEKEVLKNYLNLSKPTLNLPCQPFVKDIDPQKINVWKEQMLVERLMKKTLRIDQELQVNKNDWEVLFFQQLAYNFGLKTNADTFLMWSKSFPFSVLKKVQNDPIKIAALFFGQAGLLNENIPDNYYQELKKEYIFIRHKYNLEPLSHHLFQYFRMRPIGFPTIRLAQLAAIYTQHHQLFLDIINRQNLKTIREYFLNVKVNSYWNNHYKFGIESKNCSKNISVTKIENIVINTILPIKFAYNKYLDQTLDDDFFDFYDELKPEKDHITRLFEEADFIHKSALDSQAFHHAYRILCLPKKCLNCNIGHESLKQNARPL